MRHDEDLLKDIEWVSKIQEYPEWAKLKDFMTGELDALKEGGLAMRKEPNPAQKKILELCNLDAPQTSEDRLETYLCLVAVVSFVQKKFYVLETNKKRYEDAMRELRGAEQTPKPASER